MPNFLSLRAGDTWQWTDDIPGYAPSDGWALTFWLRGTSSLDVAAVPDGDAWKYTIPATTTAAIAPGFYAWLIRGEKDGEVVTMFVGDVQISPNIAAIIGPYDPRTTAEKQLAAAEECLTALLGKQHTSVSFGGQSYSIQDIEKLLKVRDRLREQVAAEKAKANGGKGRRILVHFSDQ
ncbi:MAG: hypothetical protein V4733_03690 [Verrucomicrobiota bacterium]